MGESDLVLSIETTTTTGSLALIENPSDANERILHSESWRREKSHAEALGPAIEKIASHLKRVSLIAVGVGPGSFTGIRVGLNAARALGWALSLPVFPVVSTENILSMASASGCYEGNDLIIAVLPAQMGLVFAQWVSGRAPVAISPDALAKQVLAHLSQSQESDRSVTVLGEGRALVQESFRAIGIKPCEPISDLDSPTAFCAARIAARALLRPFVRNLESWPWRAAQPLYIRGSGAEEKGV